jgi:hypothetical protein
MIDSQVEDDKRKLRIMKVGSWTNLSRQRREELLKQVN